MAVQHPRQAGPEQSLANERKRSWISPTGGQLQQLLFYHLAAPVGHVNITGRQRGLVGPANWAFKHECRDPYGFPGARAQRRRKNLIVILVQLVSGVKSNLRGFFARVFLSETTETKGVWRARLRVNYVTHSACLFRPGKVSSYEPMWGRWRSDTAC